MGMLLNRNYKKEVDYSDLTISELKTLAKGKGLEDYSKLKKDELIDLLKG